MAVSITFKESELPVLIDLYLEKLKSKKDEINTLEKEAKEISAKIVQLKRALNSEGSDTIIHPIDSSEIYSDKWQWTKKIQYAIDLAKKPLTVNEIVDTLGEVEPAILTEKRKAMSSISGTLSNKSGDYKDKKEFVRSTSENGDYAYSVWKEIEKEINYELKTKYGTSIVVNDLPF